MLEVRGGLRSVAASVGELTTTLKIAFRPAGGGAVARQVRRVTLRG